MDSSTAVPPGNCVTHGYHGCVTCPRCSTSTIPPAKLAPSPPAANLHGALLAEAMFGERIPECRKCGALNEMTNLYDRAAVMCNKCGWIEANEQVKFVPKDERLR